MIPENYLLWLPLSFILLGGLSGPLIGIHASHQVRWGNFQLCSPSRKNNKREEEEEEEYGHYREIPSHWIKPLENPYWRMNCSFIHHLFCKILLSPGTVVGAGDTAVDETWTLTV